MTRLSFRISNKATYPEWQLDAVSTAIDKRKEIGRLRRHILPQSAPPCAKRRIRKALFLAKRRPQTALTAQLSEIPFATVPQFCA